MFKAELKKLRTGDEYTNTVMKLTGRNNKGLASVGARSALLPMPQRHSGPTLLTPSARYAILNNIYIVYVRSVEEVFAMRVQEHVKLSTAAALLALPWLKKEIWIPLAASILIDVDHYLWHSVTHRTLSLRAAVRYFGQADPPQLPEARLLHNPLLLGLLLVLGIRFRSRLLLLVLAGLLFHVSLDAIHVTQMSHLKRSLSEQAANICPQCKKPFPALQLHTVHFANNLLDRYNPAHFVVLCPDCHEQAHAV
jgi:hypothetical protein